MPPPTTAARMGFDMGVPVALLEVQKN